MKKRSLVIICLILSVIFCLSSCGGPGSDETAETEKESVTESHQAGRDSQTETDKGSESEISVDTETEPSPESETEKHTETETEKPSESDSETETAKEPETETDVETEIEIETETETEKHTETETVIETETETETETAVETETETETETEIETETETETETEKETEPPIQHSQLFLDMKAQIENYQKTNPEVWGWLYIEAKYLNTSGVEVISYPLMLGTDNEYYLTHKWDRSYSKLGAIFADCRTDPDMLDNRNVVIYGHNMAAGTMLHKLLKVYKSKSVFMGTNGCYVDITIYTTEAIYKFDLFSMYVTSAYSDYRTVYFVGDTHWVDYLNARQKLSKWSKNYEFNENDMMITFSTCTDEIENGRMAFHCILTEILY
ncbi:MAG: sortase [Clostridia bacterium]|nr:sortase [Clostridia bacterium]